MRTPKEIVAHKEMLAEAMKYFERHINHQIMHGAPDAFTYSFPMECKTVFSSNWAQIKKENMTKRERFLKAGGLFGKPKDFDRINVGTGVKIRLNFKSSFSNNELEYDGVTSIDLFHGRPNHQDKDYPNQKAHFENILSNTKSDTWIASRDREIKISDLADKHLVNIMRYLVAHWEGIRDKFIEKAKYAKLAYSGNWQVGVIMDDFTFYLDQATQMKNSSDLVHIIMPFKKLTEEFTSRFGYDSLNSIYEGN